MSTPVPSPDIRQRRNQSQGVAYPVSDDDDEGFEKRNYGVQKFRRLPDAVIGIRKKVEKERLEAQIAQDRLKNDMVEQEQAAKEVHKELSLQLKVAGRSYDQLLTAMRELNEQLRQAEERRIAEVEPLQREVKNLKQQLAVADKPYTQQIKQQQTHIMKLQEVINPLEQEVRNHKLKMGPVVDKLKEEIKRREEATEIVLKEVQYWKDHVDDVSRAADEKFRAEQQRAREETSTLREQIGELKVKVEEVQGPYKKQVKELKYKVESLEHELSEVDYDPFEKRIALQDTQYKNLARDFEIKDKHNQERMGVMRESYESLTQRMNKKLKDLMLEKDDVVKPYQARLAQKDIEIDNLEIRIAHMKEAVLKERDEFAQLKKEMEAEVKTIFTAMDHTQEELVRVQQEHQEEKELQKEFDPRRSIIKLETKLDEVTRRCQTFLKIKDEELMEKCAIIQRLHGSLKEKQEILRELDDEWQRRIVKKEEGYEIAIGELAYAEGQIVEERKNLAKKQHEVLMRERDILALNEAHTEELRVRQQVTEDLQNKIRMVENEKWSDTAEVHRLHEESRQLQEQVILWQARAEAGSDALLIDLKRQADQTKIAEDELQKVRQEVVDARNTFNEKEAALDLFMRNRDRHINQLKNELEIINDSWEIKYNSLIALFEKLQRKYDDLAGPNGSLEMERRNRDLKVEINELAKVINDLKEQIKKSKRRNRDLEIEIDATLKETADIIYEKDRGIAKMVGDMAKLQAKYQDLTDLFDAYRKEKELETVIVVESYQGRVNELEQLVESLRFTDRQALMEKLSAWRKAYERSILERDALDDEHDQMMGRKEAQILAVVQELQMEQDKVHEVRLEMEKEHEKLEHEFRAKEVRLIQEKDKLESEIRRLTALLQRAEIAAKQLNPFDDAPQVDEEKEQMKRELAEKEEQIEAMTKGIDLMAKENATLAIKADFSSVNVDAIHESYKPILAEKDKAIKRMEKDYVEMKNCLEIEWYKAQQACRAIEERVKKFPNPFEIEVRELKDQMAEVQVGLRNMSLENLQLKDQLDRLRDARVREVNHLEVQLKGAVGILKDIAPLVQGMSNVRLRELEQFLQADADGRVA